MGHTKNSDALAATHLNKKMKLTHLELILTHYSKTQLLKLNSSAQTESYEWLEQYKKCSLFAKWAIQKNSNVLEATRVK